MLNLIPRKMKNIRMSLSGLAQNSRKDLLQEVASFLENSYHGEKSFEVEDENIVEVDLFEPTEEMERSEKIEYNEPIYWSLAGEPIENTYNTFDINLDC